MVSDWHLIGSDGEILWSSFPEETIARGNKITSAPVSDNENKITAKSFEREIRQCVGVGASSNPMDAWKFNEDTAGIMCFELAKEYSKQQLSKKDVEIEKLESVIALKESERKEWAEMCIRKQEIIEQLQLK